MAIVKLSNQDRVTLEIIATQTEHSRELRRAQALLWLDEGEGVDEVAARLGTSRPTVYYWVERFAASSGRALSQRLADAPRSGRPATADGIIDESIDEIIETDPRLLGYRATVWTAPLLRQYLADSYTIDVSPRSVSYALARLGLAWKRPRYDLIRCSPTWRQAKGGSNAGSRSAPARSFSCWTKPSSRKRRPCTAATAAAASRRGFGSRAIAPSASCTARSTFRPGRCGS